MNFEIVLASNNKHKLQEIREILSPHGILVYSPNDINIKVDWSKEDGKTYFENALIKAKDVARSTTLPVIADDSGIEIEAMNNEPGIFSARFADAHGGSDQANDFVLETLRDSSNRKARFVCDIVLLNMGDKPLIFEGVTHGEIAKEKDGTSGFGYDPIFVCEELQKTYSSLSNNEKNSVSHRYKALRKLLTFLRINGSIVK